MTSPAGRPEPSLEPSAWLAPGATVIGAVTIGSGSSIWFGVVARADQERIDIGQDSNIQDGTIMHSDPGQPLRVGDRVSVGHGVILHGCTIGDDALIGMGAIVLNGASIGEGSLVAAGALVLEGAEIPPRSLVAGVPGRVRRPVSDDELAHIVRNGQTYCQLSSRYASGEIGPGLFAESQERPALGSDPPDKPST
jgi:carbonic anhydrase/acetyltransferase-like protein (isoleucine patch superfamily)